PSLPRSRLDEPRSPRSGRPESTFDFRTPWGSLPPWMRDMFERRLARRWEAVVRWEADTQGGGGSSGSRIVD
ncbi:unnamed protein product, partial [Amoebophrya sp. A25]